MRVAFGAMILAAFNIVLTLLAFRPVMKPVLTLLFMVSAGVAYFHESVWRVDRRRHVS
jgi:lipid A ethanolaminephosphotransferase